MENIKVKKHLQLKSIFQNRIFAIETITTTTYHDMSNGYSNSESFTVCNRCGKVIRKWKDSGCDSPNGICKESEEVNYISLWQYLTRFIISSKHHGKK